MILSGFFCFSTYADSSSAGRSIIHILDYISQDYSGAVQNGKVISQFEFDEQKDFIQEAVRLLDSFRAPADVRNEILALSKEINSLRDAGEISERAQKVKLRLLNELKIAVAPAQWPNLAQGEKLFKQSCVNCHGPQGKGDGPLAAQLEPRPTNFHDLERMSQISPFQVFNTVKLGVKGTPMTAFPYFSDEELWSLAFYISSLRHHDRKKTSDDTPEDLLAVVASLSDIDLEKKFPKERISKMRTKSNVAVQMAPLDVAKKYLILSREAFDNKDFEKARTNALMAYLEGIELVEQDLRFIDKEFTARLEKNFSDLRNHIGEKKSRAEIDEAFSVTQASVAEAGKLLSSRKPLPLFTSLAAIAILVREGFEAILILITLLGIIRVSGSREAAKWVHGGWVLALLCGVATWFLSGWVLNISGFQREVMEGAVALFAVIILLYMGFWLHRKMEIGRWTAFVNNQLKSALQGGSLVGIGMISFMAVFREAFETVLFLRALWLQGGSDSKTALLAGVAIAFVLIFLMSWALLKYSARLPVRTLFSISSIVMVTLAVILVGKGLHSFQESGMFPMTELPFSLRLEVLGLYPTVETLLPQVLLALLCLGIWLVGRKPNQQAISN